MKKTRTKDKPSFAFFDLDYTLIPHDTLLLFCNYVLKRQRFRLFYAVVFMPFLIPAALKLIGSGPLKTIFLSFLWRIPENRLQELAAAFVRDAVMPEIYPDIARMMEECRERGYTIILNTASPEFYVKHIASALRVDSFFATQIRVEKRMPFIPVLEGKNNKRFVKLDSMRSILPEQTQKEMEAVRMGTQNFTAIPQSCSFSDSPADLPMLRLAEEVVLVHPLSKTLKKEAAEKGWHTVYPSRPYSGTSGRLMACILQAVGLYSGRGN